MDTVVLPVIVLTVAPEGFKNTYLAVLGISGLLMAATVQPTIGRISDRYQSRLGRRVPFIFWGATFAAIGLMVSGWRPTSVFYSQSGYSSRPM